MQDENKDIYLGRIVVAARNRAGEFIAGYRVSSRSFPDRTTRQSPEGDRVSVVPRAGHEADIERNPYIAYNCALLLEHAAVLTNGSHTDPVAEKMAQGMPARDALVLTLAALDYEKDDYNTPRVAIVIEPGQERAWLGVVRADGLDVRAFALEPGTCLHLSTYEHDVPDTRYLAEFDAADATAACGVFLGAGPFARFTHPVTAVAVRALPAGGFEVACADAQGA